MTDEELAEIEDRYKHNLDGNTTADEALAVVHADPPALIAEVRRLQNPTGLLDETELLITRNDARRQALEEAAVICNELAGEMFRSPEVPAEATQTANGCASRIRALIREEQ